MIESSRDPDLKGPPGRYAYRLNWEAEKKPHAGLAGFVVFATGYHPFWSEWLVMSCHLRDEPGVPPAKKQFPEATHELQIVALDPESVVYPDSAKKSKVKHLTPVDQIVQVVATDQEMIRIVELAATAIVSCNCSPDQDYRSWWKPAVENGLKHMRGKPCGGPPLSNCDVPGTLH